MKLMKIVGEHSRNRSVVGGRGRELNDQKSRWPRWRKNERRCYKAARLVSLLEQRSEQLDSEPNSYGELPLEVLEQIIQHLGPADELRFGSSSRGCLQAIGGIERLATLRGMVTTIRKFEEELIETERHLNRLEQARDYYKRHNWELHEHGVSYKSVARKFRVSQQELRQWIQDDIEDEYYEEENNSQP